MKIDLDNMSKDELKDLVIKFKKELDDSTGDLNTTRIIWEYLCHQKDKKITELTDELNKLKGEQNEQ